MTYKGKLYGLIGKTPIPLTATSEDVDRMEAALKEIADGHHQEGWAYSATKLREIAIAALWDGGGR